MRETTIVVGSSIGGVRAAQALRSEGYRGRIVLVGEEKALPYDKPPLSKDLLTSKTDETSICLLNDEQAAAAGIELHLGRRAECLDTRSRQVLLHADEPLSYDYLVLATGARAKPLPWPASRGKQIHVLRTVQDSVELRRSLSTGGALAVIGAGFIGAEVASSARSLGLDVTLIDPLQVPMARVVGSEVGELWVDLHRRRGTSVRFGLSVEWVEQEDGGLTIGLSDGNVVQAAMAVVGIGTQVNDGWLMSSGLRVENGVICDEYCRALGADNVYAVGDVARWYHLRHEQYVRVEHWTNAVEQAACVAYNIMHPNRPRAYQPVEYVWSNQYNWKVQIAGRPEKGGLSVTVGRPGDDCCFAVIYAGDGGEIVGAVAVNWPRGLIECRRTLASDRIFSATVDRLRALHG